MGNLSLEERDELVKKLAMNYIIPNDFREIVKEGIKKYANKEYSENTLNSFVEKNQSIKSSMYSLNKSRSHFAGYLYEWITCIDYNTRINKGNCVLTIVNPDPTSKADLLHIVKTNSGYKCVPGPDVKSGQPAYVLNQFEKAIETKPDIAFVDISGHLTTNRDKLKPKQKEKLECLERKYPRKKPLVPKYSPQEHLRILDDILIYDFYNVLPSKNSGYHIPRELSKYQEFKDSIISKEYPHTSSFTYLKIDDKNINSKSKKEKQRSESSSKEQNSRKIEPKNLKANKIANNFKKGTSIVSNRAYSLLKEGFKQVIIEQINQGLNKGINSLFSSFDSKQNVNEQKRDFQSDLKEQVVKAHSQRYHTKEGVKIVEKKSYYRNQDE